MHSLPFRSAGLSVKLEEGINLRLPIIPWYRDRHAHLYPHWFIYLPSASPHFLPSRGFSSIGNIIYHQLSNAIIIILFIQVQKNPQTSSAPGLFPPTLQMHGVYGIALWIYSLIQSVLNTTSELRYRYPPVHRMILPRGPVKKITRSRKYPSWTRNKLLEF